MKRVRRLALAVGGLAAAGFGLAGGAAADESHAEGSAATRAGACKLAQALARQDISTARVKASRCECLQDNDDPQTPWSCTAFVTFR